MDSEDVLKYENSIGGKVVFSYEVSKLDWCAIDDLVLERSRKDGPIKQLKYKCRKSRKEKISFNLLFFLRYGVFYFFIYFSQ